MAKNRNEGSYGILIWGVLVLALAFAGLWLVHANGQGTPHAPAAVAQAPAPGTAPSTAAARGDSSALVNARAQQHTILID